MKHTKTETINTTVKSSNIRRGGDFGCQYAWQPTMVSATYVNK